ncbi:MAG: EF-hand domain-containing protein [Proteobacteria bacterium]|nr:EF-hand domain-containing protein [Pseudomonadota bacterium]
MKKILIIIIGIIACITLVSTGFTQEKSSEKFPKVRMRVRAKGDFVGKVVKVDATNKIISVKNKGIVVTFDVANPRLIGYKSLDQIKMGDSISVGYTGDGAIISRFTGKIPIMPTGPSQQKRTASVSKKGGPVRMKERTNSTAFNDVDQNTDGKISPAELSAIIPGLTMEQFKKYDKNGDGCLDRGEYSAVR